MRYQFKKGIILVIVFLGLALSAGIVAAKGFSADVVSTFGKETSRGKIFVYGLKMRYENGGTISITRMDKNIVWVLMPTEKMYMEQDIKLQNVVPGADYGAEEVERTLLGNETVNGYVCEKYRIVVRMDKQKQKFLQWLSVNGAMPVKIAAEDGKWSQEYRNISPEEPDQELFEIPKNYQKFSMSLW